MEFSRNRLMLSTSALLVVVVLVDSMTRSNISGGGVCALKYPSPPPMPARFNSAQEVQRYLNQLRNYYLVVGRPRFGKRSGSNLLENVLGDLLSQPQEKKQDMISSDLSDDIGFLKTLKSWTENGQRNKIKKHKPAK